MRKLTLLAGFCLLGSIAFGQTRKALVGLEMGTKLTRNEYKQEGMGYGVGAFADLPLYHKLGLSTGVRFAQLNYEEALMCSPGPDYDGYCPYSINRFYALELPIGLNLDLSFRQNANWKVHLKTAYVLGRTLATESILVRENDKVKSGLGRWRNPMTYTHGAEFAMELQGFATRKYMVAIGPSVKFTQLLHGEFQNVTVIGINLKVGRNLNVN